MPFNMLMLTCVIAAPSETEIHASPTNPILLAHRGLHIGENRPDTWDKARTSKVDGICTDWPLACSIHWHLVAKAKSDERQARQTRLASESRNRYDLLSCGTQYGKRGFK